MSFPEIQFAIFGETQLVQGLPAATGGRLAQLVEPSQYRIAPMNVTRTVHVIYLISPAK